MAYYLDFSSSTQGRILCDFVASQTNPDWEIEFKIKKPASPTTFYRIAGESDASLSNNRILIRSDGTDFRFSYAGSQYIINPSPAVDLSLEPVISFKSNGSGVSLFIDGILKGTGGSGDIGCTLGAIGANFNSYFTGGLYYFKFTDNTNTLNSRSLVKETLSGSNDNIFNDELGNQDGVQSGTWPSDNSEWIFYSDSTDVEAEIDFTISSPSFSVTASASLPQPESDIDFSVGSPAFSAAASVTLPDPAVQVDFSVSVPAFSASASATLPSPDSSIDFDISSPVFSVVAFAGTIDIIVDDETNINLPALSNNVTLPALSNNIDL